MPAIVPAIVGGLRIGLAAAVPWAIAGEYLGAQTGLGAILWRSSEMERRLAAAERPGKAGVDEAAAARSRRR